MYLLLAAFCC